MFVTEFFYDPSSGEIVIDETIRKVGSQYRLYSHTGKNLGTYGSRAGAEKRERQVNYFKHTDEGMTPDYEYLNKAEQMRAGQEVWWKGRLVGWATGEVANDRVYFKPNPSELKGMSDTASLPLGVVRIKNPPFGTLTESVDPDTVHSALRDFLPFAMKELGLEKLPKIKIKHQIEYGGQPSFGCYKGDSIELGIKDRHPVDICRTLAHELVHYKQGLDDKLTQESGATGSPEENEANSVAGVIMRKFSQKFPKYINNES